MDFTYLPVCFLHLSVMQVLPQEMFLFHIPYLSAVLTGKNSGILTSRYGAYHILDDGKNIGF